MKYLDEYFYMESKGTPVISKKFGKGTIVRAQLDYIEVEFDNEKGEEPKAFLYPAVFLFGGLEFELGYIRKCPGIISDDSEIDESEAFYKEYGYLLRRARKKRLRRYAKLMGKNLSDDTNTK